MWITSKLGLLAIANIQILHACAIAARAGESGRHEMDHTGKREGGPRCMLLAHQEVR